MMAITKRRKDKNSMKNAMEMKSYKNESTFFNWNTNFDWEQETKTTQQKAIVHLFMNFCRRTQNAKSTKVQPTLSSIAH